MQQKAPRDAPLVWSVRSAIRGLPSSLHKCFVNFALPVRAAGLEMIQDNGAKPSLFVGALLSRGALRIVGKTSSKAFVFAKSRLVDFGLSLSHSLTLALGHCLTARPTSYNKLLAKLASHHRKPHDRSLPRQRWVRPPFRISPPGNSMRSGRRQAPR